MAWEPVPVGHGCACHSFSRHDAAPVLKDTLLESTGIAPQLATFVFLDAANNQNHQLVTI